MTGARSGDFPQDPYEQCERLLLWQKSANSQSPVIRHVAWETYLYHTCIAIQAFRKSQGVRSATNYHTVQISNIRAVTKCNLQDRVGVFTLINIEFLLTQTVIGGSLESCLEVQESSALFCQQKQIDWVLDFFLCALITMNA